MQGFVRVEGRELAGGEGVEIGGVGDGELEGHGAFGGGAVGGERDDGLVGRRGRRIGEGLELTVEEFPTLHCYWMLILNSTEGLPLLSMGSQMG